MAMAPGTTMQQSKFLNLPVDIGRDIWDHIDDLATFRSLSLTSKAFVPTMNFHIFNFQHSTCFIRLTNP